MGFNLALESVGLHFARGVALCAMAHATSHAIADWPVPTAAAAVVGPSGVLAEHGDVAHRFALASVTKPLVARAAQVAIEEGVVELDTPAGPPGSTVRHLLAHASGPGDALDGSVMAEPGNAADLLELRLRGCWPRRSKQAPASSSAAT